MLGNSEFPNHLSYQAQHIKRPISVTRLATYQPCRVGPVMKSCTSIFLCHDLFLDPLMFVLDLAFFYIGDIQRRVCKIHKKFQRSPELFPVVEG